MNTIKTTAVLFDFDGVVMDTETQYSIFWHKAGVDYLGMDDLESRIKGQTMTYIYDTFFAGKTKEQQEITAALNRFERDMDYEYIPGVLDFITDLRRNHVKMAVVTSSNDQKMSAVYRARPEVKTMFVGFLRQKCLLIQSRLLIASCSEWKCLIQLLTPHMYLRIPLTD